MQIILLEKVDKLGNMGEIVTVKPGYARNFLLPKSKALRATEGNIAYFEKEKAALEKLNGDRRDAASKESKKIDGMKIVMIRQASEGGMLYGSITARDIAEQISAEGVSVRRGQVKLNQNFKMIGLFSVDVELHPEVVVSVPVNIARSEDEAKTQFETGKPVIVDYNEVEAEPEVAAEDLLEDAAIATKQASEEAEEQTRIEEEAKEAERAAKRQAKAEAEAAAAAEEGAEANADDAETAESESSEEESAA